MKKTILILMMALGMLSLTACTSSTDMVTATDSPTSTATQTPTPTVQTITPDNTLPDAVIDGVDSMDGTDGMNDGSAMPAITNVPESTGVTSMDRARRVVEQIEDELERLSEVDDAQVIIAGNKAAVGLEFDDQYQAGVDDRLREIVRERIDSIISGISTVAITADQTIMDAIESLGDRLDTMSDMTALKNDVDAIIQKIEAARA